MGTELEQARIVSSPLEFWKIMTTGKETVTYILPLKIKIIFLIPLS
jgi:hypothetical protein